MFSANFGKFIFRNLELLEKKSLSLEKKFLSLYEQFGIVGKNWET